MSIRKTLQVTDPRTGTALAQSTIRRKLIKTLKAMGYKIKWGKGRGVIEAEKP